MLGPGWGSRGSCPGSSEICDAEISGSGLSYKKVDVLLTEQHAAEIARRLLGIIRVVRARGVDVEERALDRAAVEDRAAAALGEERVDDLGRAHHRHARIEPPLEPLLDRQLLA